MSTINQGILGGFSGKVGTVIGGNWNGINYMRGLPTSYTNPRTEAQLMQRARFAETIKFLRPLTSFLRIGFKNQAYKMSGFNAAMSYTIKNALTGIYPSFSIDYNKVLVSRGPLPGALNPAAISSVACKIDLTWDDNSSETGAAGEDKALVVIYSPLTQKAVTIVDGVSRAVGNLTITLPESFSGQQVHCYIGFQDASQAIISDSAYVGAVLVA